jgi:hypothetical protein
MDSAKMQTALQELMAIVRRSLANVDDDFFGKLSFECSLEDGGLVHIKAGTERKFRTKVARKT